MTEQAKIGTVEGTGSAINVECGFLPDYVEIINLDSSAGFEKGEWITGMANPSAYKTVASGTRTKLTTTGIGMYAGTAAGFSQGFSIGADADLNVAGETIAYRAVRNL
tara:strand:- start:1852 stop:2175 length:324 start_codon:yes stop_codon:yes gene_type:complete